MGFLGGSKTPRSGPCLGVTAPAQQDFFVQVVEDVMKWDDCWTTTGRKAGNPDGSRKMAPLEVVRQCCIAHGGQPLGHMLQQGWNLVPGFPAWNSTGTAYTYIGELNHAHSLHVDNKNDAHNEELDGNYIKNTRYHGYYRILLKCQEGPGESWVLFEDARGSNTWTLWLLSGITMVCPNSPANPSCP